jgi:hypothetical protein
MDRPPSPDLPHRRVHARTRHVLHMVAPWVVYPIAARRRSTAESVGESGARG